MSETTDVTEPTSAAGAPGPEAAGPADGGGARKRGGGLASMLLADLKSLAKGLGVAGAGSMKKAQLVEAIRSAQSGAGTARPTRDQAAADQGSAARRTAASETDPAPTGESTAPAPVPDAAPAPVVRTRTRSRSAGKPPGEQAAPEPSQPGQAAPEPSQPGQAAPGQSAPAGVATSDEPPAAPQGRDQDPRGGSGQSGRSRRADRAERQDGSAPQGQDKQSQDKQGQDKQGQDAQRSPRQRGQQAGQQGGQQAGQQGGQQAGPQGGHQSSQQGEQQARQSRDDQGDQGDDLDGGGRNRRRRGRDRERNRPLGVAPAGRNEVDTTILEDDVLVPAAGILDVLDNYAFVRTSGYLPGVDDVYVSLSMVRRFGLRRGDALVGQVRQPREGERKEKFNPMVEIDTVNGHEPGVSKNRVDFDRLTPLHPSERLRLETGPTNLVGRVIDVAAPIGKGQRGLVVSPSDAGKTELLRSIAGSVTANHPECHLMVVLLDERPEEVTDFERAVNGEVISSTFDRPPADHTAVAELAIERAKRLVELGHDVVVLLDGITRLGRAYDLAAAPHGRQLPGGLDAAALHPTKRFFGAARNLENGGSLTILATAAAETGSAADAAILDALTGTGNLLIRLRGDLAAARLFPAIDAVASGTRHEELLMSQEEVAIVHKLRAQLAELDPPAALRSLLERLRRTQTNIEFLMQVQRST